MRRRGQEAGGVAIGRRFSHREGAWSERGGRGQKEGGVAVASHVVPHSLHSLPHIAAPQAVAEVLGRLLHPAPQRQWGRGRLWVGGLSPRC